MRIRIGIWIKPSLAVIKLIKRHKLLTFALMLCYLVIHLQTQSSTHKSMNKGEKLYFDCCKFMIQVKVLLVRWRLLGEDISCHYEESDPVLPVADASFNPPARSIYFHETSCLGLNSRQACAVESAARMNPEWQINLLLAGISKNALLPGSCLSTLMKIPNVMVLRVHIAEYAKGTPSESIFERGALYNSIYRISHTSDVLRYITLYKYGGIYMDLDIVVVKPLDHLEWNFAVKEPEPGTMVGAAVMSFSRNKAGREIADACIREMASDFSIYIWNHNGPDVILRVLTKRCNTSDATKMTLEQCKGFHVYDPKYFYPVGYDLRKSYFKPGKMIVKEEAYTHHMWNAATKDVKVHPDSPYAKMAKMYCPNIYELLNDQFGE